ncbi:MAG TPA: S53 family serine peptidase [Dyella sp.]|uniref:S53 family peptidase n=1 Tax=Dyella sp. TaxID=1869338 RepID=UPI002D78B130|nr:S53 family serine peptidase [Dyella sp.]HET6555312.1 S53 family serine peptidase [Dyella sp.]
MSLSPARHSHWPLAADARYVGPHEGTDPIDVTVVMRRRGDHPAPASWPHRAASTREAFGAQWGADPADAQKIRSFAKQHGLIETGCELHRRVMHLRGTPQQLQEAFGVQLGRYQVGADGEEKIGCRGKPALPSDVAPAVIAVLGLDQRPVARPHFRRLAKAAAATSFTPVQIGKLYAFPTATDGTGQTIAVIELGGGYTASDFSQYMKSLGITKVPKVSVVSVAGGKSKPGGDADAEVMLDVEVIGALASGASIVVYFAPNTDQGFYEAISQAAHDTTHHPSVISISWGGPEDSWASSSLDAMQSALQDAAALGVTVTAASGDSGSTDGETDGAQHVDFPASSPYVLACGGTKLTASTTTIKTETVWNEEASDEGATGGGVSSSFALPTWQTSSKVPKGAKGFAGRGVPDVAGDADPTTGYTIRVDGQNEVIGGTSAVAPLWAALVARCNQHLGQNLGDPHEALYSISKSAFRDITSGNNGSFKAAKGWDACTGLGSPKGQTLLTALSSMKPTTRH